MQCKELQNLFSIPPWKSIPAYSLEVVNILVLFDLTVSHYTKPNFCLIRLGKAQEMTVKTDLGIILE